MTKSDLIEIYIILGHALDAHQSELKICEEHGFKTLAEYNVKRIETICDIMERLRQEYES